MYLYNETPPLSQRIMKTITPTKWGMCKFFIKVGILGFAATYYLGAVTEQIKKNEKT